MFVDVLVMYSFENPQKDKKSLLKIITLVLEKKQSHCKLHYTKFLQVLQLNF